MEVAECTRNRDEGQPGADPGLAAGGAGSRDPMAGGGPFASGLGVLGALLIILALVVAFPVGIFVGVVLIIGAVVLVLTKREEARGETPADPVTGGKRWWQKRFDE